MSKRARILLMKKPSQVVSIHPKKETIERIRAFYSENQEENSNDYIDFFASFEGTSISIYKPNKKGVASVVFSGQNALSEARIFDPDAKIVQPKAKTIVHPIAEFNRFPQIGSDEVGTGDLFGPIIVVASYVEEKDLPYLKKLGVTDSKLLSDETVSKIGPRLIRRFDYSLLVLMPEKYNEVNAENNMNAIKAKMHNRALDNLHQKYPGAYLYIDQFAEENIYYSYLKNEPDVLRGIIFSTKGELHYASVALSSVIARYVFLKKMKELSRKMKKDIPFGAGKAVDEFLQDYLKDHPKDTLKKFAKMNFANFKKIDC